MIKADPFVSIIIPAKNEEHNIGKCLSALASIDYPKYEIILIDNGSTDKTIEVAKGYGAIVFEKPELTISGMRNYGARHSSGDVLAFVDADVVVSKMWLRNAIMSFDETDIGCVGCSPNIPEESTWVETIWHLQIKAMPQRETRKWLASMNMIVRRDVFFEMGGFNEALITCEDVDLGYRISTKYRIVSDKRIEAVHLGEAKSLKNLFRKEFWRGKSNYSGLFEHGLILSEVPSLFMPIWIVLSALLFIYSVMFRSLRLIIISILGLMTFPLLQTIIISYKLGTFKYASKLPVVWFVYGVARGVSALDEFRRFLWHN